MIFSDQDKGKRSRLEDGYRSLENKKFSDYTDEDLSKVGTIDVALELYTHNYEQGTQMAMLEMADKVNNHEIAIIDNCLCMRRIAPPPPGMIHNKKVMTDPVFSYMWTGYVKVIAVHSLSYKDSFRATERSRYWRIVRDHEKRLNEDLPVGGYEATDLQGIVLSNLFARPDYCDNPHADCPQFVPEDYVPQAPEQID
ncbi:hypothetical protein RCM89_10740 [Escherichia marmotae]|uniref:hypothetical protein n=1 Tax=Escherichia sp. MOD1-EC5451 TaxID=2093873 RepID=UPI000CF76F16|nr:hypothetical protein [Escherichia sp. MOD1-EC5451]EFG1112699.1 hypothetical protein [Escherichia coli]MEC9639611.1 hypothetical protein [Escherichia marmotae]MEC9836117.1 hypothetical protein [Escherichia marmotae]MEC9844814.1 hypothetical protein [Escherichia marmotae]MEC9937045.1 hypothetical protein [Escherichia marmotae]